VWRGCNSYINIKQSDINKGALKKTVRILVSLAGLRIRIHVDRHYFGKSNPDPNPHESEKLDLDMDPHLSQNSGALDAQNRTVRV
jgi:hypothetical protein